MAPRSTKVDENKALWRGKICTGTADQDDVLRL
jgi:hypothetical protein